MIDSSMDFQKRRFQFIISFVGIIVLSITAEKCRQLVGEDASSKSGQFTLLNCFDMSTGTLACTVKTGVKMYFYNIRSSLVERKRQTALEAALVDALSQGLTAQDAAKQAQKEGAKAAKLARRQAKRIIGPIISSGWDFFEAIYYGGTLAEGFLRGTGTLFGTYAGGFLGEQRLGRFGYLIGSQLGSWVGGRLGLMVYDVVNGVHFLLNGSGYESVVSENFERPQYSYYDMFMKFLSMTSGASEDSSNTESPAWESQSSESEPYEESYLR